jgi:uncharacterized membrane protein SpoIIM required for sporulation
MREAAFVKQNLEKWEEFDKLLNQHTTTNPDRLAELYISLTDDLSFAQTQYPGSSTHQHLNQLAQKVHMAIYRNKKEKGSRFITFWKWELPLIMFEERKKLLYAFLLFALSCLVGALSAANDDTYVRLILGDGYVNQTLDNIDRGDPMAIYKSQGQLDMFFGITFNNIRVSFSAFVSGVLGSIGTGFILFYNGIMLGSFQYFFFQKGLFLTSFLTIWIHGTLEISAIVIAGAAGMVMGNSILFPGTYSRMESFKRGAIRGLKIVAGLIPVFIMAGFLESFITRLTEMPTFAKVAIIGLSAIFIVYYFIIYPYLLTRNANRTEDQLT